MFASKAEQRRAEMQGKLVLVHCNDCKEDTHFRKFADKPISFCPKCGSQNVESI